MWVHSTKMWNGRLTATVLFAWILLDLCFKDAHGHDDEYALKPSYDICNPKLTVLSPPIVYLGNTNDTTEVYVNWQSREGIQHYQCLVVFRSCSSCQIQVEPVGYFFYPICRSSDLSHIYDGSCAKGCVYFHLFDADYKTKTSLILSQSRDLKNYSTQSRQLHVVACGNNIDLTNVSMRLRLSVKKKETVVNLHRWSRLYEFSSPFFPNPYILNNDEYIYEFIASEEASLTVTFDDWQISPHSFIRFYNANIIGQISGAQDRPYIKSTGSQMTMVFNTGPVRNSGLRLGFSAIAKLYEARDSIPSVYTDCDKTYTSSGGFIHLGTRTADGSLRDCIWLVRKPTGYERVQIRVVRFQFLSDGSEEIEIRDGLTSQGLRRLYATGSILNGGQGMQSSYDSGVGFYIRLKGRFYDPESLVISYSSYFYGCSSFSPTFTCNNKRCISDSLKCDSYDHCGDNSDEATDVCGMPPDTNNTNHSSGSMLSVGVIIPIVVSVVLVIVMCLIIIFIRRCRRLNNETYGDGHSRRHSGPGNSRGRRRRHRGSNVQMSVTVTSGEHPPSYNEVIQNSPQGGLFNMAFSWSGADSSLPQPPSYQEAIAVMSTESSIADLTPTGNPQARGEARHEINERAIDVGGLESSGIHNTLNPLLDPASYISSSSSSEDLSDRRMDSFSSSDSSMENEHSFASNTRGGSETESARHVSHPDEDRTNGKDGGKDISERQIKFSSSPSSGVKLKKRQNTEIHDDADNEDETDRRHFQTGGGREKEEADRNNENKIEKEHGRRINRDHNCSQENIEDIDSARRSSSDLRMPGHDHCYSQTANPSQTQNGREVDRNGDYERIGNRQMRDGRRLEDPRGMYPQGHLRQNRRNEADERNYRPERNSHNTGHDNWRSHSLADLSLRTNRGISLMPSQEEAAATKADKRFSYAGTGDTTVRNGGKDPYPSRALLRDSPIENRHRSMQNDERVLHRGNPSVEGDRRRTHSNGKDDHYMENVLPVFRPEGLGAAHSSPLLVLPEHRPWEVNRQTDYHATEDVLDRNETRNPGNTNQRHSNYDEPQRRLSATSQPLQVPHGNQFFQSPTQVNADNTSSKEHKNRRLEEENYSERAMESRGRNYPHSTSDGSANGKRSSLQEPGGQTNLSSLDRRQRQQQQQQKQPPAGALQSRSNNNSLAPSAVSSQPPSALATPSNRNANARPKPRPRRSLKNSQGTNPDQQLPAARGHELELNTTPLSVVNYVASSREGGRVEASNANNNRATSCPLAQVVFKATDNDDDVYV